MTSKQFVEGFAPLAFYESLIQQQERETARLTTLLKDVADDRAAHMRKWQDERAASLHQGASRRTRDRQTQFFMAVCDVSPTAGAHDP
jgi:hypothetical protein